MNTNEVTFAGAVPSAARAAALASPQLQRWVSRLGKDFDLRSVHVREVVMFGSRAGFVLAEADVRDAEGRQLPGVAFLRGDSVAVLPVLVTPDGERMAVLVRQARVPAGLADYYEIPAGMLDDGAFASKAIEELAEEVGEGVEIREGDLVQLWEGHTTPGGSDEAVRVYAAEIPVDDHVVGRLMGRLTGNRHEKEAITVAVAPLDDVPSLAGSDMKTMLAWHGYRDALVRGLFPARDDTSPAP